MKIVHDPNFGPDEYILTLDISRDEVAPLLGIEMTDEEAHSEPEPSNGVVVETEHGYRYVLIYGLVSKKLGVYAKKGVPIDHAVASFLRDSRIDVDRLFIAPLSKSEQSGQ
jgi:hypothetical protein